MMMEAPNFADADFFRVRFAICGGEPCPLPVIGAYQRRGVSIRQGYGLTEAGPNCFSLPAQDAIRKEGSIGFPNFHIGARLMKEDGTEAQPGQVGELQMKGPHLFAGYWRNAEETARTLQEGWLRTGDLLTRDEEGYFFVVGRKKEMYISGGENVYPVQVERVLQSHAAVAQAAVVSVPDPHWGESGWAYVKLREETSVSVTSLLSWCQQHLAKYQCPKKISILAELPIGASGKTDKLALGRLAREEMGVS
jgi:fatty-acyl-CoA synthase